MRKILAATVASLALVASPLASSASPALADGGQGTSSTSLAKHRLYKVKYLDRPCHREDQLTSCYWDAGAGNGVGYSWVVTLRGDLVYVNGDHFDHKFPLADAKPATRKQKRKFGVASIAIFDRRCTRKVKRACFNDGGRPTAQVAGVTFVRTLTGKRDYL